MVQLNSLGHSRSAMLGKRVRVESSAGSVAELLVVAERLDGFLQAAQSPLAAKNTKSLCFFNQEVGRVRLMSGCLEFRGICDYQSGLPWLSPQKVKLAARRRYSLTVNVCDDVVICSKDWFLACM